MKIEYCYYVAKKTEDGLIKIVNEKVGPYYDSTTYISSDGYPTKEEAIQAMENYRSASKNAYGWQPYYTALILEEITVAEEED